MEKSVLYFSPGPAPLRDLRGRLARVPGCAVGEASISTPRVKFALHAEHDAAGLLDSLHRHFFNLLVFDLRAPSEDTAARAAASGEGLALLDLIEHETDVEARYGFHRVVVLVSGNDDQADRLIAQLGAHRVGRVLRGPGPGEEPDEQPFGARVLDELSRMVLERRPGRTALCCSGGGITGIFFEMGALKCLDDCLRPGRSVSSLDLYFGISAGAVVTGLLANGYSIDECMSAIAGVKGRLPRINLSIFRWSMLDAADIRNRLAKAIKGVAASALRRNREGRLSLESLLLDYSDLFGPPLRSDDFERTLRQLFEEAGTHNDFRQLSRKLYIGATDQDLRAHVLFGEPGLDHVPVSQAIQASLSLNPAFSSSLIDGRYYSDGAVTHTSHVTQAIEKGADLLFVVDPFVPYVSRDPGYARSRGFLYNIDQDVRTMSYTRFERSREAALRSNPWVSSYTFVPANSLRRFMSMNPMDHRPFLMIWRGAYLSTLRRLQRLRHRLAGDLAFHGMGLDLSRAEEVAARLRAAKSPVLADFFANGKVEPKTGLPAASEVSPALADQQQA